MSLAESGDDWPIVTGFRQRTLTAAQSHPILQPLPSPAFTAQPHAAASNGGTTVGSDRTTGTMFPVTSAPSRRVLTGHSGAS